MAIIYAHGYYLFTASYAVGLLCRSVIFTISRRSIMHVVIRVSGYSRSFRNDKAGSECVYSLSEIEIIFLIVFFCSYTSHAYMKHMMTVYLLFR